MIYFVSWTRVDKNVRFSIQTNSDLMAMIVYEKMPYFVCCMVKINYGKADL